MFGLGFGPFIAAWLLSFTTWRGVFVLVTVPGLILSGLIWLYIRDRKPAAIEVAPASPVREQSDASIGQVLKVRNVRIGMLGLLCAMCGIFTLAAFAPLYLTEHLHLDAWAAASAIGFGGFVSQWILPTLCLPPVSPPQPGERGEKNSRATSATEPARLPSGHPHRTRATASGPLPSLPQNPHF